MIDVVFSHNFSKSNLLLSCHGESQIKATLERNVFYPEEKIIVHLKISNERSRVNLENLTVQLFEVRKMVKPQKNYLKLIEKRLISSLILDGCRKGKMSQREVVLKIPADANISVRGMIMNIYYTVVIKCHYRNNLLQ